MQGLLRSGSSSSSVSCSCWRLACALTFTKRNLSSLPSAPQLRKFAQGQVVPVSSARLEQLLEAEITTLSLRDPKPLTLQCLLEMAQKTSVGQLAELLHEELPVRFAQRIKMLEALPEWKNKVSIASIRNMYVTSFKELRLADPDKPEQFQKQIRKIRDRHSQTNKLVGGFKQYSQVEELQEAEINEWLDRFFALRVSTNMLMAHYLQVSAAPGHSSLETSSLTEEDDEDVNPYRSWIDPQCKAKRIADHAAHLVGKMCTARYRISPPIIVEDKGSQAFPFVPRYLFFILSELLKNSVRAVVETHARGLQVNSMDMRELREAGEALPPVRLLISGDENVCCCRVADEGGGIPLEALGHVWSYLYTTAEPLESPVWRSAVDSPADLSRMHTFAGSGPGLPMHPGLNGSPLAGLGCGLPLSRLYARYLGGSVELQSMPRYGTDVYVYLNRLGESEHLPTL